MDAPVLCSGLKERRLEAKLQQRDLAKKVGVSRQTLSALEAGQTVPATSLALQLARVLGCRVEDLFWLKDQGAPMRALLVPVGAPSPDAGVTKRVAVAAVDGRWIARLMDGSGVGSTSVPADGLLDDGARLPPRGGQATIVSLREPDSLRQNLFAAGCDPALALLAGHLEERHQQARMHWVDAGSGAALAMLARGEVHVAGLHLFDERTGEYNVAAVKRAFARKSMVIVNLAVWEQGLAMERKNPRRIREVADLTRKGVRLIGREEGTGSDELLRRLVAKEGIARKALKTVGTAHSHAAVARAIALGAADVGITTREAATSHGLDFLPLAEARFDLAMPGEGALDPRLQRLLDVIQSARFRRELGGLVGYGTSRTGDVVAELAR